MRLTETHTVHLQPKGLEPASEAVGDKTTVFFHGACPLYPAQIGHYAALDRDNNLRFVDVSEEEADLGEELTSDAARRRFHVRLSDGTLLPGAPALIEAWRALPQWRRLAPIATLPGVPTLMEGLNSLFLRARPALSKLACVIGIRAANLTPAQS